MDAAGFFGDCRDEYARSINLFAFADDNPRNFWFAESSTSALPVDNLDLDFRIRAVLFVARNYRQAREIIRRHRGDGKIVVRRASFLLRFGGRDSAADGFFRVGRFVFRHCFPPVALEDARRRMTLFLS